MNISKSKLWLIITIIIGLVTTALIMSYISRITKAANSQPTEKIVLTVKKIKQGTMLTKEMLKTVEIPTKYIQPQWAKDLNSVLNKYTLVDLEENDVVILSQLTTEKDANQLAYKVPKGKRAVTTAVTPPSGIAGHVKPGDYVDVLVTYKTKDPGSEKELHAVVTLVQNVEVLAVGPDLQRKEGVQAVENVTLALLPKDAQLLAFGESLGKIKLTLRSAGESGTEKLNSVNLNKFLGMYP